MPLPELIEIEPLAGPVRAEITVPGSKSITNRALILAALAKGETTLRGALWSEDTQVMVEALRTLGFEVRVEPEPEEACNRTITVKGLGGWIPWCGTPDVPLELYVGNAGTAARFLAALVCLRHGAYRLHGVPRMHERPQAALFAALRELGYRVDTPNDRLPAVIFGGSSRSKVCEVSVEESSQFASALLLCAEAGGWTVYVRGANEEELPYVEMTRRLCAAFPKRGGEFHIEPDASSGSYFWAAAWLNEVGAILSDALCAPGLLLSGSAALSALTENEMGSRIKDLLGRADDMGHATWPPDSRSFSLLVKNWPLSGWQIDADFPSFLPLPESISREGQLGDSIMTAIVLAAIGYPQLRRSKGIQFTDLARLRLQECERVAALRTELTKCGAKVVEEGDTLTVFPSELHGAEIETYNDHRMAMCFAILGLKVPGVRIKNPACVKKTFPNFFQKLAAPPPAGLGAVIRDARTGRVLQGGELLAE